MTTIEEDQDFLRDWFNDPLKSCNETSIEELEELQEAESHCSTCERGEVPCIVWVVQGKCMDKTWRMP